MVPKKARIVVGPAVLWGEQGHGGLVPVFGLAADITHGLVDQNRDLIGLLAFGDTVGFNFVGGQNLLPHGRHHAVDLDPAIGHPVVRFTARTHAQLGHAFVQAGGGFGVS